MRGTSEQTVHDIVLNLLVCAVMTTPLARVETAEEAVAPPAITALLDDLAQLAMWRRGPRPGQQTTRHRRDRR